jgi:cyanophycinase
MDQTQHGVVFAIGGNEDKRGAADSILGSFVERAGGREARLVVIPSASAEPELRGARYARIFKRLGAESIRVLHATRKVSPDALMLVTNATGIFITGGDQAKLMRYLHRNGAAPAILDAVAHGAVYAGTSAGASAVSRQMIAGSRRIRGTDLVRFGEGLGLLPNVIVDQHFSQRQRLTRLIAASTEHGMPGLGIDENTAVIWEPDGTMHVSGTGAVTLVNPELAHTPIQPLAQSYRLHVYGGGTRFVL